MTGIDIEKMEGKSLPDLVKSMSKDIAKYQYTIKDLKIQLEALNKTNQMLLNTIEKIEEEARNVVEENQLLKLNLLSLNNLYNQLKVQMNYEYVDITQGTKNISLKDN